jgi:uncharacterized membrane protein (DUF4010 family)
MKLARALAVGLLIGLEREWSQKDAGVRTFAIAAPLGALTALSSMWGQSSLPFASVALLVVLMNAQRIYKVNSLEIATAVTLIATPMLGVLIGLGHYFTATSASILMTLLLSFEAVFSLHRQPPSG